MRSVDVGYSYSSAGLYLSCEVERVCPFMLLHASATFQLHAYAGCQLARMYTVVSTDRINANPNPLSCVDLVPYIAYNSVSKSVVGEEIRKSGSRNTMVTSNFSPEV